MPRPGFEGKVFYVWFDAPIAYIAATQDWATKHDHEWRDWWWGEAADRTAYVQLLGKDNVPFHAVSFPATLIGSGEPWRTVDVIKGFHWLTHEGGKFSTSHGRGLSCEAALDAFPADLWRWWLIANAPETADVDFRAARFVADVNKDLADVFGNLVQRVTRFASAAFDGRRPTGGEPGEAERTLVADVTFRAGLIRAHHEAREFRRAAAETRALWTRANAYVQDAAPWSALRHDPARAAVVTRAALGLVEVCAAVAWSIIPTLAASAIASAGGTSTTGTPAWPKDIEAVILAERDVGQKLPPFQPVAKIGIDHPVFGSN